MTIECMHIGFWENLEVDLKKITAIKVNNQRKNIPRYNSEN